MGKKPDPVATMTRVDLLARIIELKDALDWRDRKLAEQEATIERLQELLDETRTKLSEHETSGDSPRRATPPRYRQTPSICA
jgi:hypothetical protein